VVAVSLSAVLSSRTGSSVSRFRCSIARPPSSAVGGVWKKGHLFILLLGVPSPAFVSSGDMLSPPPPSPQNYRTSVAQALFTLSRASSDAQAKTRWTGNFAVGSEELRAVSQPAAFAMVPVRSLGLPSFACRVDSLGPANSLVNGRGRQRVRSRRGCRCRFSRRRLAGEEYRISLPHEW